MHSVLVLHSSVGRASDIRSRDRKFEYQLGCIILMEIDHEIISSHSPTSADSRRVAVSYWQKYVHKYLLTG